MHKNIRKVLLACSYFLLLMSFQCDKEEYPVLNYPETNITLSEGAIFSTNDTLWITGVASTMVYNEDTQDSIPNMNENLSEVIGVLRLQPENRTSNTTDAVNDFELITRTGTIDFLSACPEADIIANGPRTANGMSYRYEIGLVPKNTGDFALNWVLGANLINNNLNLEILEKYPIDGDTNQLGLTKCGITSTLLNVGASKRAYFFTVE